MTGPEEKSSASDGRRVLVIEDNEAVACSMKLLLELDGHIVAVANSGEVGVASAKSFYPQIVLCDLGLPGMTGYEVARALRSDPATQNLYLIALSGYGRGKDRDAAKEAGFDLHLTKPVDPDRLAALIAGERPSR